MQVTKRIPIAFLVAVVVGLGPVATKAEASRRYGIRTYSYRTYPYRPYYRGYRPYYRPYYWPYYRTAFHPYSYGGYWGGPYFGASFGPFVYGNYGPPYATTMYVYEGGQAGYSYQHGSIRTQVQPNVTEVYVDGYYAGIADDFDGTFQRLYVPPGRHVIELQLEGYRTHRQTLMVNSGTTYKIHHEMVPLAPGETTPPPPQPQESTPRVESYEEPSRQAPPSEERERTYREELPSSPSPSVERGPTESRGGPSRQAAFGLLSLRIMPADAEIIIDGEMWGSLEGMEQIQIHLPAGRHRVEIRKEGYSSFATEVDIREGETTPLNIRLAL